MRGIIFTAAMLAAAVPAAAQHQHQHGGQQQGAAHQHGETHRRPDGWQVRLDRPGNAEAVHFMDMNGRLHAELGPAGIFYNPAHTATGAFRAQGTFTLNKPSAHPEAFGLLVGGRNLDADNQDYLYFLVRQDGKFLVKHRAGSETHTVMDWTEHAAVQRPGADGKAVNTLAVESSPTGIRLLVNGTEVATLPRGVNTNGIVGLRLNHNIDVIIDDFGIQPAM